MNTWAKVLRRTAFVAGLVGMSGLSGCATYYDEGYYGDRYVHRDDSYGGDYYVGHSYGSTYDGYDTYGYYGPSAYYDSILWPSRRYYDPWLSPYGYYGYGFPYASIGFSVGYHDPFYHPVPYRHGYRRSWYGGPHHHEDRRNVHRGEWRPSHDDDPYRRGDYRPGSAQDETARLANRRGADRPPTRIYADPDRDDRNDSIDRRTRFGSSIDSNSGTEPASAGNWSRSRDVGSTDRDQRDRYESRRAERFEPPAYAPREQPRFEQREQPRFESQEQPRFARPEPEPRFESPAASEGGWTRGRDRDDDEPE